MFLLISTITYVFSIIYGHFNSVVPLNIESLILVLVLVVNTSLAYWNSRSRYLEIFHKARELTVQLANNAADESLLRRWATGLVYPQLNTPTSPCISLQWTYRDGRLVNLPSSLLVTGDVILLAPGRPAPANCRRIERVLPKKRTLSDLGAEIDKELDEQLHNILRDNFEYNYVFYGQDSSKNCSLQKGDVFMAGSEEATTSPEKSTPATFTIPRLRRTAKPSKFLIIETPYIKELKLALTNHALHRTPTAFQKELRLIFVRYLEHILVPFICLLVLVFSIVHYCYVEFTRSSSDTTAAALALIFLRPVMAILPLLPLALPTLWLVLNSYGLIKLYVIYESFCRNEKNLKVDSDNYRLVWNNNNIGAGKSNGSFNEYSENCELLQSSTTANQQTQNKVTNNFYLDEIDPDTLTASMPKGGINLVTIVRELFRFAFDQSRALWRTANLLHVLGSITALCCVDRHGKSTITFMA